MRITPIVVAALGVVAGCSQTRQIEIISDPPGARIMVDGDYVGDAPLTHSITYDGGFPSFYYFQIEAVPKPDWGTGMFVQERVVKPPTIPSRLFFDMRLRPVYPAQPIDANVNVRGQN